MITVESLCREYAGLRGGWFRRRREPVVTRALTDVSLSVTRGEVFGVLGPNGAGKTSLIKILSTLLLPTSGRAEVAGFDVARYPHRVRERIAVVLGGERNLYWKLTAKENLEFFGALHHLSRVELRDRISAALRTVELSEYADRLVETFSRGMKQRLVLAIALLADAEVVFLDEPTNGLDPHSARTIRQMIRELSAGRARTVLLTTHHMPEAEELCHRLAILHQSRLLAVGTPSQIKALSSSNRVVVLETDGQPDQMVVEWLRAAPGVLEVTTESSGHGARPHYRVHVREVRGETLTSLLQALGTWNVTIQAVRVEEPTLEEAFLSLTSLTAPGRAVGGA